MTIEKLEKARELYESIYNLKNTIACLKNNRCEKFIHTKVYNEELGACLENTIAFDDESICLLINHYQSKLEELEKKFKEL